MKMYKETIERILNCEYPLIHQELPTGFTEQRQEFVDYVFGLQKAGKWDDFMASFPGRTWLLVFLYIKDELGDRLYYELLGQVLGNIYMGDYCRELQYLIHNRSKKYRKFMMSPDERKSFDALDNGVIYRGCGPGNRDGYSWTLDLEQARFFAGHHSGKSMVLRGEFDKADAIAYFGSEQEIFIAPERVRNVGVLEEQQNEPRERLDAHRNIYAMTLEDPVYQEFRKTADFAFWLVNRRKHVSLEDTGPDFKYERRNRRSSCTAAGDKVSRDEKDDEEGRHRESGWHRMDPGGVIGGSRAFRRRLRDSKVDIVEYLISLNQQKEE
jgi:hypothetical protein